MAIKGEQPGKKNGLSIRLEINNKVTGLESLGRLIPTNCLLGPNDTLAGLDASYKELPGSLNLLKQVTLARQITFFVHQIQVTAINEVEKAFAQFLRLELASKQD